MNFRSLKLRSSFYCNFLIFIIYNVFSHIIGWSKIQNKNDCKEILTFHVVFFLQPKKGTATHDGPTIVGCAAFADAAKARNVSLRHAPSGR